METKFRVGFRVTKEQRDYLKVQANYANFLTVTEFMKYICLKDFPEGRVETKRDFRYKGLHKRDFKCSEEMWEQILSKTNGKITPSQFIREAISDKLNHFS